MKKMAEKQRYLQIQFDFAADIAVSRIEGTRHRVIGYSHFEYIFYQNPKIIFAYEKFFIAFFYRFFSYAMQPYICPKF